MKKLGVLAVAAAAALTSGCIVIDSDEVRYEPGPLPPRSATCNAADYQGLIGRPEAQVDRNRLPQTFRIVCHECQATMDYNPNRLTLQLDAQNRVASASCG